MNPPAQRKTLDMISTRRTCDPTLRLRIPPDEAETLAGVFKALSHPARLQILDLISQGRGETCGCDIERHFELTQPTISHHLKVLRDAGLITSEARSVWIHHQINIRLTDRVRDYLNTITRAQ
jgi:ArsR family transcriptional regulator, arsenate/arsenite/antimonite-responsive transcriptional repressor